MSEAPELAKTIECFGETDVCGFREGREGAASISAATNTKMFAAKTDGWSDITTRLLPATGAEGVADQGCIR